MKNHIISFVSVLFLLSPLAVNAAGTGALCGGDGVLGDSLSARGVVVKIENGREIVTLPHQLPDLPQFKLEHGILEPDVAPALVGKTIRMDDGKEIYVARALGSGGNTTVVSDGKGSAYRINSGLANATTSFLEGKVKLDEVGAKMVDVLASGRDWIQVEEVRIISFYKLATKGVSPNFKPGAYRGSARELIQLLKNIPVSEGAKYVQELEVFMSQFALIEHAPDINPSNVVYTSNGWRLIDITHEIERAGPGSQKSLFSNGTDWENLFVSSGQSKLATLFHEAQLRHRSLKLKSSAR